MKYTISEFAELLGVTADTLRLYEKYKIIKPSKNEKNNYRYFDDIDARNMLMSRWYRSLEFSMQEAALLTQKGTTDEITDKINKRKLGLKKEIEQKRMLLDKMTELTEILSCLDIKLNQCTAKELSGIYRLRQTDKNNLIKNNNLTKTVEVWMKYLPYVFFSFQILNKDMRPRNITFDYNWGLALEEEMAKRLGINVEEGIEYIEPKKCISAVIISSGDYITRESIQFMFDYIKENNLITNGDILGKIIITEKAKEIRHSILEVNIPII